MTDPAASLLMDTLREHLAEVKAYAKRLAALGYYVSLKAPVRNDGLGYACPYVSPDSIEDLTASATKRIEL